VSARVVNRVAVLGLGKVGGLVAAMLADQGFDVVGADARPEAVDFPDAQRLDVTDADRVRRLLGSVDAVVSCLPYRLNGAIAQTAHELGVHYLDLTEDRSTSQAVRKLVAEPRAALIPHCGLAPGFICVLGSALAGHLARPERLALRVGALPRSPNSALGYAFTWSPAGVINEYLNECEVLRDGRVHAVPALAELETLVIDGARYEAFTTSGGLGTMCDSFAGELDHLDYKTIRYPKHCELIRFFLHELRMGSRRQEAEEILRCSHPPVVDDLVVVLAVAEGERDNHRVRDEFARAYRPRWVAGERRTAIAWTTAAGVVGVLHLLAAGELPDRGLIRQERIPLDAFFGTPAGALLADEGSTADLGSGGGAADGDAWQGAAAR
jgi:saccharopine dehydrogenase-like NADP-dependent oxidoreductase